MFPLFQSEKNKTENSKDVCILCFSSSVDEDLSKFQISRKQRKIFCHIPKKEEGTVGELVIRCPAPVPFHSLSEWDVGLDDLARILGSMYRTKDDQQLKCTRQRGSPFLDLKESISMIFNGFMRESKEKTLFRKLLYTNAGRVLQSNDCELWKHSFLSPLFPRESTKGCFEILQTVQQFRPEGTSSFPLLQQDMNPFALLANHLISDCPSLAEPECAFCHSKPVEPLKKCLGCKKVFYCRKECQTKHWRDHKAYCRQHKT
ncbi:uncharacterized protein [Acropora muricata]